MPCCAVPRLLAVLAVLAVVDESAELACYAMLCLLVYLLACLCSSMRHVSVHLSSLARMARSSRDGAIALLHQAGGLMPVNLL